MGLEQRRELGPALTDGVVRSQDAHAPVQLDVDRCALPDDGEAGMRGPARCCWAGRGQEGREALSSSSVSVRPPVDSPSKPVDRSKQIETAAFAPTSGPAMPGFAAWPTMAIMSFDPWHPAARAASERTRLITAVATVTQGKACHAATTSGRVCRQGSFGGAMVTRPDQVSSSMVVG